MIVKRVWLDKLEGETTDPQSGDVDVMVEMENGELWTAHFVTIPYLQQQLSMSAEVVAGQKELGSHAFVALETPHVITRRLDQHIIEDIVEDLMTLGTFETVFDLVIDVPEKKKAPESKQRTTAAEKTD